MFFIENFPEKLARKTLKEIIEFFKYNQIISNEQEVSVAIKNVSKNEIKKLNKQYRKKDQPTDILSFGYEFNQKILEGDLVLCWEVIQKNAREDQIKVEEELKKNLIHGCLHLTGLEHSNEMFELQDKFLKI
jgi:probable rRNA maturation factor